MLVYILLHFVFQYFLWSIPCFHPSVFFFFIQSFFPYCVYLFCQSFFCKCLCFSFLYICFILIIIFFCFILKFFLSLIPYFNSSHYIFFSYFWVSIQVYFCVLCWIFHFILPVVFSILNFPLSFRLHLLWPLLILFSIKHLSSIPVLPYPWSLSSFSHNGRWSWIMTRRKKKTEATVFVTKLQSCSVLI